MTVSLAVVGLGMAAIKTAADFNSAMARVAAVSGVAGDDLQALKDRAREMCKKGYIDNPKEAFSDKIFGSKEMESIRKEVLDSIEKEISDIEQKNIRVRRNTEELLDDRNYLEKW